MTIKNVCLILVLTLCLMSHATPTTSLGLNINPPGYDLAPRLAAYRGQVIECWKALQGLMSCSNLTVQFFLTGKADVAACCRSIDFISTKCSWPSTITSLGYTPAEGNILKSYCDALSAPPGRKP